MNLDEAPSGPGVYAIFGPEGPPHLGRTAMLRRRLARLLAMPRIRDLVRDVRYWPTASRLESSLVLYELARQHMPERYVEYLKLRMPPYVRLLGSNPFPRTQVTARLAAGSYGPFRTRAAAEEFERGLLDLFQIRRCQEDLVPHPEHPGCIYGEMGMCLRPCQGVVSIDEYATEAARVAEFLRTGGQTALHTAEAARDRMSAEMEFEEAARQHKRAERIAELLGFRDGLAADVDELHGLAVLPSVQEGTVLLQFMKAARWMPAVVFASNVPGETVSMDRRLREVVAGVEAAPMPRCNRGDHVALLARWYFSSWRDGTWIAISSWNRVPYRRIVSAISLYSKAATPRLT